LVWGVLRDLESSLLEEKEKTLFRFIDKVNRDSPRITADALVSGKVLFTFRLLP
jgi:hypothetical protein